PGGPAPRRGRAAGCWLRRRGRAFPRGSEPSRRPGGAPGSARTAPAVPSGRAAGSGRDCRTGAKPCRAHWAGCCVLYPSGASPVPERGADTVESCIPSVPMAQEFFRLIRPRTPAGVMELLPREQIAFQRMLDVIRRNYERFGFLPVETPVFELSDVLLTKSGGETERQVYFVQSTGALANAAAEGAAGGLPEMALRFDLTVPLARYVAEHEHELSFPFRRYQMQRVYRGERAQRGRFREFYQCDIDVIGKDALSIRYDAE